MHNHIDERFRTADLRQTGAGRNERERNMAEKNDLIQRAKDFAVRAHTSIVHLRKYTKAPYATHLENVSGLVASVTRDPETIAAAWLHDVVEDTPVTIEDLEREFGRAVAGMVESLTDVSRPSDGNRAARKEKDRTHLATASPAAKTVKLADLIDNCRDICRNDQRFAPVYLEEMEGLLEVLKDGDPVLYRQARETHEECSRTLGTGKAAEEAVAIHRGLAASGRISNHLRRLFRDAFTIADVADPVRSFDAERDAGEVRRIMDAQEIAVACIRQDGLVAGYVQSRDLSDGRCQDHLRSFRRGQVLPGEGTLSELIMALTMHEHVFISLLGEVGAVAGRESVNTPVARMWLFGIITLTEMQLTRLVEELFPEDSWKAVVTEGRLAKAAALREERLRRGQHCRMLDCLQLSDKGQLLAERPELLQFFGFESKRTARKIVKELESLRNNLAHAQDVAAHDWAAIARLASRVEEAAEEA